MTRNSHLYALDRARPVPTLTGDFAVMLRGINVGRSGRVTMADLRRELIAANIDVVATVVQSGNLVVRHWTNSATNLARSIEQAMSQRLDITSRAIALNPNQLGLVIQANPFADVATDPSRYLVHLCEPRLTAPQYRKLEEKLIKAEYVALKRGFVYQWCPEGISSSQPISPLIERVAGVAVTARNWRTLHSLADLL